MRSALSIVHPLHSLPSILAIEDVARGLDLEVLPNHGSLLARLAVDPLAVFRAIRLTCAPIQSAPMLRALTLDDLVVRLGANVGCDLFCVPATGAERTRSIRRVWLRHLAVATLAEQRAHARGPDAQRAAYLSALLTPKQRWLEALAKHHNGGSPDVTPDEWTKRWHLHVVPDLPDFEELDREAEALGFSLDERPEFGQDETTSTIQERLSEVGIDLESVVDPDLGCDTGDGGSIFDGLGTMPDGDSSDFADIAALTRSLVSCRNAPSVRSATQLALQTAVTHLDFDRAFTIQVSTGADRVWIRSRADKSPLPFRRLAVTPSDHERQVLGRAHQDGTVQMLVRHGNDGLCTALGTDRALVATIQEGRHWTRFVVLDRAVRCRDLDFHRDGPQVAALASLLSMLQDNLELRLHRQRADLHARTDSLTGLLNRGAGIQRMGEEVARARRTRRPLCAMMMDLDKFKELNDTLGHQAGDEAIRLSARILRQSLREEDILCRMGGEEFLIVLPETDAEAASVIGTRLFVEVEQAGLGRGLPLTTSIGLAELGPADDAESLVGRADHALFASKSHGRNRLSIDG